MRKSSSDTPGIKGSHPAPTLGHDQREILPLERRSPLSSGKPHTNESLVSLVTAVRWGVTAVGVLWTLGLRKDLAVHMALGAVLGAYALFRTFVPIEYDRRGWRSLISIIVELCLSVAVVVMTECWDSPFIFSLFTPVIAAGFARGYWHALRIAVTGAVSVALAAHLKDINSGIRPVVAWSGELLLVAAVASYGRRLLTNAEQVQALSLSQIWRLNEANALLMSLNRLAHDLPVSFDFQETLQNALSRARSATTPDVAVLLLLDPLRSQWSVMLAEGAPLPGRYPYQGLPEAVGGVTGRTVPEARELSNERPGFASDMREGMYVPLWAGPRQVGLLAVESRERGHFGFVERQLLHDMADSIALTIDNARWFDRLRARGAAQERNRIARDLHDRVGQGIAYLAFELDRLATQAQGTSLHSDLEDLRSDARSMVHELRETLYDLRTDVSEEHGLIETIEEFLSRVGNRSTLQTSFQVLGEGRLPLVQEREVWRIAQEAIVNVERHAEAGIIDVTWTMKEDEAVLTVTDDGVGLDSDRDSESGYGQSASPGRPSYGITGMGERADNIGGLLEVTHNADDDQAPGTTVRLTIPVKGLPWTDSTPPSPSPPAAEVKAVGAKAGPHA